MSDRREGELLRSLIQPTGIYEIVGKTTSGNFWKMAPAEETERCELLVTDRELDDPECWEAIA